MLYLTCTMISSVDLAHYGLSRAKDWVSVDCGTNMFIEYIMVQDLIASKELIYKPFLANTECWKRRI